VIQTLGLALLVGVLAIQPALAAELKPTRVDGSPLWPVHYYAPDHGQKIEGLVIMISDRQGWDAAATAMAQHLTHSGEVVVGLDLPIYRAALEKEDNDCVLVTRDLEVLSRDVEQSLPFAEFRPPVILGLGAGSGIAYAAIGQVLPNTFAAGIGLRFDPFIDVGHKLCLPLTETPPGSPLRYGPVAEHDTPFFFTPSSQFAAPDGGLQEFLSGMDQAHVIPPEPSDFGLVDSAMRQIPHVGKPESSVDKLPIVEVPPAVGQTGEHPLVIFYSGDGGWRDIDKRIGGYLSDRGYFVVGVDSLRYFWRRKEPHEMAADLDRLIRHYSDKARQRGVILVGYSFGADLLPFMINRLAPDTRAEVRQVSLVGIADRASFEIRLQGILGAKNTNGPPTLPELQKLKNIPIQCIYGFDEHDSVCAQSQLDGIVDRYEIGGGHHYDGDYMHIANLIVTADQARMETQK